jgi:hypothetical protein
LTIPRFDDSQSSLQLESVSLTARNNELTDKKLEFNKNKKSKDRPTSSCSNEGNHKVKNNLVEKKLIT